MASAADLLASVFGFASFRPGQAEIVAAVAQGRNTLAIMPTGGGKSLCFQLPALMRGGVTVVISPLIALMRDQVRALRAAGVEAGALTSANTEEETAEVLAALHEVAPWLQRRRTATRQVDSSRFRECAHLRHREHDVPVQELVGWNALLGERDGGLQDGLDGQTAPPLVSGQQPGNQ